MAVHSFMYHCAITKRYIVAWILGGREKLMTIYCVAILHFLCFGEHMRFLSPFRYLETYTSWLSLRHF